MSIACAASSNSRTDHLPLTLILHRHDPSTKDILRGYRIHAALHEINLLALVKLNRAK